MEENIAFEEIIKKTDRLPTVPGIALKLLNAVRCEQPDLNRISKLISSDPSISAEILRCINSPYYSLKTKVTSVNHAVSMLGMKAVKNLALSFSLVKNLHEEEPFNFNYESFWKDSLIGAVSARSLVDGINPDLAEDAFFIGLLHNVGILTLVRCLPKQYSLVIKEMKTSGCAYHEVEDQVLGFNHMAVGKHLIEFWGLPELFYMPIGFHHHPDKLPAGSPEIEMLTRILHLATLFIDLFNDNEKCFTLRLIEHYSKKYKFDDKFNIDEIGKKVNEHTQKIFPLFEISVKDNDHYSELIESARKEIINLSGDLMNKVVQQQHEIQRLREQIIRDAMTPLINYQYFHELLEQELYRARRYQFPLSIIIVDIDDLKTINDAAGHQAGDYVIQSVANCMRNGLRQSDHIARYGGDRFAIILPETPLTGGLRVAERLKKALDIMECVHENKALSFTLSYGVATLPPDQNVPKDKFIKMAEMALSTAKANGKNQYCAVKN